MTAPCGQISNYDYKKYREICGGDHIFAGRCLWQCFAILITLMFQMIISGTNVNSVGSAFKSTTLKSNFPLLFSVVKEPVPFAGLR